MRDKMHRYSNGGVYLAQERYGSKKEDRKTDEDEMY